MKRAILFALLAANAIAQSFTQFTKVVDNAAALQGLDPNDIHKVVFMRGYTNALDADGAIFYYDSASATATNTTTVFKPTSFNGRWLRQLLPSTAVGSGTVTSVGLTAPAAGIHVTGVSPITTNGTFGLVLTNDLAAVEALATTGFVKRTGAEAWSTVATVPVGDVSGGAALTDVDDTNVTLTLGGSPSTSVLAATSLTLGWAGQLSVTRGGSGASTLTGYLKGNGASAFTASATVPASDVSSGAALTKVDDTNVTLTLGGSPSTSLLSAASLTLGWSGTLANSRGGTGTGTYTTGDILYASAANTLSKLAIGSTSQVLTVTNGIPAWFPAASGGGGLSYNFDTTQFGADAVTNITIKSGATLTNTVMKGSTSGTWTIGTTGIFESTGAQTLRTSTGNLTLESTAGNGSIVLTPHGTGLVTVPSAAGGARGLTIGTATAANNFPLRSLHNADATVTHDFNNLNAGTSARSQVSVGTDAGSLLLSATSLADSVLPAQSFLSSPSTFTSGLYISAASAPIKFGNNFSETAQFTAAKNLLIGATAETGLTGAGGLRVASTTSATSSTVGALIVGDLTAATTVTIGGGKMWVGNTTTAASSGVGALIVGTGIDATTVRIGGGRIEMGGTIKAGGTDITGTAFVGTLSSGTISGSSATLTGKLAITGSGITLGAAVTTFAVTRTFHTITGDAGGNTIATITGGVNGMILILKFVDALVTITDDNTGTANTVDLSAAWTSSARDTLTLVFDGTSWLETARSVN